MACKFIYKLPGHCKPSELVARFNLAHPTDKRALFVLTKIDEILAWERRSETEQEPGLLNWDDTCVNCGQGSIGGWRN